MRGSTCTATVSAGCAGLQWHGHCIVWPERDVSRTCPGAGRGKGAAEAGRQQAGLEYCPPSRANRERQRDGRCVHVHSGCRLGREGRPAVRGAAHVWQCMGEGVRRCGGAVLAPTPTGAASAAGRRRSRGSSLGQRAEPVGGWAGMGSTTLRLLSR